MHCSTLGILFLAPFPVHFRVCHHLVFKALPSFSIKKANFPVALTKYFCKGLSCSLVSHLPRAAFFLFVLQSVSTRLPYRNPCLCNLSFCNQASFYTSSFFKFSKCQCFIKTAISFEVMAHRRICSSSQ